MIWRSNVLLKKATRLLIHLCLCCGRSRRYRRPRPASRTRGPASKTASRTACASKPGKKKCRCTSFPYPPHSLIYRAFATGCVLPVDRRTASHRIRNSPILQRQREVSWSNWESTRGGLDHVVGFLHMIPSCFAEPDAPNRPFIATSDAEVTVSHSACEVGRYYRIYTPRAEHAAPLLLLCGCRRRSSVRSTAATRSRRTRSSSRTTRSPRS